MHTSEVSQKEFAKKTALVLRDALWKLIKLYVPNDKYILEIRQIVDESIFKNVSECKSLMAGYEEIFSSQRSVLKIFLYALVNIADREPEIFYKEYLKQNQIFAKTAVKSQKIRSGMMKKSKKVSKKSLKKIGVVKLKTKIKDFNWTSEKKLKN